MQARLGEVTLEDIDGLADGVACRANGVDIVAVGHERQMPDKFANECRRPPAMHGETDTDAFVIAQLVAESAVAVVGHADHGLVGGIGQLACHPCRVTCC